MESRGGMFLLGRGSVCFSSPRTGCGHVNHPGRKSEGPQTHLLVLVFIKKKERKEDEDNNLRGRLRSILIISEQGKNKLLEQAGMWPGALRRQAQWDYEFPYHLGLSTQGQPTRRTCVQALEYLPGSTPVGTALHPFRAGCVVRPGEQVGESPGGSIFGYRQGICENVCV